MFGLGDLFESAKNVTKVVAAPFEVTAAVAKKVTKTIAEPVEDFVDEVKDAINDED